MILILFYWVILNFNLPNITWSKESNDSNIGVPICTLNSVNALFTKAFCCLNFSQII